MMTIDEYMKECEKMAALKTENERLRKQLTKQMDHDDGVIARLKTEVSRQFAHISDQDHIIGQLQGNIEGYAMRCRQLDGEIERLKDYIGDLENHFHDYDEWVRRAREAEQELASTEDALVKATEDLEYYKDNGRGV